MEFVDADTVAGFGPAAAVGAIVDALRSGLDPAADISRIPVDLAAGQFLLMPSESASATGVKIVGVAPENPDRGLPRIQATYLLLDQKTLTPLAVLDGTALTTLRTPAVSVAAVLDRLPDRPLRVVVIGGGPQATGHLDTLAAVRPIDGFTCLVRDPSRTALPALRLGSADAEEALGSADVVMCATSAREPLFDSALLRDDVVVTAVGSHESTARELDSALLERATVVVEDESTALREAGDVVLAVADGVLTETDLVPMRDAVLGRTSIPDGPLVFKGVGMSWQDLVVAAAIASRGSD